MSLQDFAAVAGGEAVTRYARSGDVNIAYQVTGDGPIDVVYNVGWVSNVELDWEMPRYARWFRRLEGMCRLIRFDKRGVGLSDRVIGVPLADERMDDLRAVMDAADSERAAIVGESEGGPMAMLFAATYPERVLGLALISTFARAARADDYPLGATESEFADFAKVVERAWGNPEHRFWQAWGEGEGGLGDSDVLGRWMRQSVSPGGAAQLTRMNAYLDVRAALPAISAPTLVVHRIGDPIVPIGHARYVAARIAGATLCEIEGSVHDSVGPEIQDLVAPFLATLGATPSAVDVDRVLASVLMTDIVDSTAQAAAMGDREWVALLDAHDQMVDRLITQHRGRRVKQTGDGILATFDGPARAVLCAKAIAVEARVLGIEVRAGLHAGEVELRGDDIGGIAVHVCARISALAGAGEVLVSSTVRDLTVGSGLDYDERGRYTLKGVPGEWLVCAPT